jgi:serine/threonine protein kinase
MRHPNIIAVLDVYDTPRTLSIVLELACGGELFNSIVERGSFTEPEARAVFRQILEGLAYLHERGIAHRDIKPESM